MKSFIVAACIVACAYAASIEKEAQVLRSNYEQSSDGKFQYAYETENGISGQVSANVVPVGKDEFALQVEGSNSYKSPDGEIYSLSYVADENGYRPVGAHLPTPPAPEPIPEYIARALEYIAAHPYDEKKQN